MFIKPKLEKWIVICYYPFPKKVKFNISFMGQEYTINIVDLEFKIALVSERNPFYNKYRFVSFSKFDQEEKFFGISRKLKINK